MSSDEIQHQFEPKAESVSRARHLLVDLEETVPSEKLDHLRLLVTELVTNAVRHAGLEAHELIDLRVAVQDRSIRVEVRDSGPGFEKAPSEPLPEQVSGRGLYLVELLSDRWGVEQGNPICVWFELSTG